MVGEADRQDRRCVLGVPMRDTGTDDSIELGRDGGIDAAVGRRIKTERAAGGRAQQGGSMSSRPAGQARLVGKSFVDGYRSRSSVISPIGNTEYRIATRKAETYRSQGGNAPGTDGICPTAEINFGHVQSPVACPTAAGEENAATRVHIVQLVGGPRSGP
ncbi:hypothetical protein CSOJ01_05033 [Colletotrichum sojae]|uniref:Uncharacterized protein n=1 Tax=Colletotrichum sojae TaxID=2175907 RepID=A0A8H6MXE9_9PEZI|nr:hypothetical protein CSOJ01_05033 [Colletotrichum sojae]